MTPAQTLAKEQAKAKREALELAMLQQLRAGNLIQPQMQRQYVFHSTRKWAFDFAWVHDKIALEVDGGTHTGGRHVRGDGYERDCEKLNAATVLGWRVLRVTGAQVRSGNALSWVHGMFKRVEYERSLYGWD